VESQSRKVSAAKRLRLGREDCGMIAAAGAGVIRSYSRIGYWQIPSSSSLVFVAAFASGVTPLSSRVLLDWLRRQGPQGAQDFASALKTCELRENTQ